MNKIERLPIGTKFSCRTRKEYVALIKFFQYLKYHWVDGSELKDVDAWDYSLDYVDAKHHLVLIVKDFNLLFFTTIPDGSELEISPFYKWLKNREYKKGNSIWKMQPKP